MSININPSHKGRLHRALGVSEDQSIPAERLQAALKSNDPHLRSMAQFAANAKHFKHPKMREMAEGMMHRPVKSSFKSRLAEGMM